MLRLDARRIGVFNLVGTGGFLVQMATLAVLTRVFGWNYAAATVVAIELAILHNYWGHCRWTWADRLAVPRNRVAHLLRYQTVKSAILAMNLGVTMALVSSVRLPPEVANLCAVGVCSAFSYVLSDRLLFRQTTLLVDRDIS